MLIDEFVCHADERAVPKPVRSFVSYTIAKCLSVKGTFRVLIQAAILNYRHAEPPAHRYFSCVFSVEAAERDVHGSWREAVRARLIEECLSRWEAKA
jgi:hypothetical protein